MALQAVLADFEVATYTGLDCARIADELAATEKACAAARILAARRAAECGAHRARGFSDAAAWIAKQSGTTRSQAKDALTTAERLGQLPDTKEAFLHGQVSLAQAAEIARSEQDAPGGEAILLDAARNGDLGNVRDRARDHRQKSTSPEDLHRRQMNARRFRHWQDSLGMVCFEGALPPATGIPLVNQIDALASKFRRRGKRDEGGPARFDALAADALAEIALRAPTGSTSRSTVHPDLVIVCDLYAWRRGHAHETEPCHLIGGGPIPVSVAKELADDAFLKIVMHDGVAIHDVLHVGRYIPVELRTALDLGPVPAFSGRECVDCGWRYGLEYDHVDPVANTGPTSYSNIRARCRADHTAKTERDRKAGLLRPRKRQGKTSPEAADLVDMQGTRMGQVGATSRAGDLTGHDPPTSTS